MSTEFEKKYNETKRIREKYPERVPVIVEKAKGCNLNDIDKKQSQKKKQTSDEMFEIAKNLNRVFGGV